MGSIYGKQYLVLLIRERVLSRAFLGAANYGLLGLIAAMGMYGQGHAQTIDLSEIASRNNDGGFVAWGVDADDQSGFAVSGAGDVNGDGFADVVIGAPYADTRGFTDAGEAYVVFGKNEGLPVILFEVTQGLEGFAILGVEAADLAGMSVSGAGDVNGDGFADLIIGAPLIVPSGEAYVVFGKNNSTPVALTVIERGSGGFAIKGGVGTAGSAGTSVSAAGDVNGDGLADVIVGAPETSEPTPLVGGSSFVIFGKSDGTTVQLSEVEVGAGGFAINGGLFRDRENGSTGESVSGAGDVNGDGLADVVVGAPLSQVGDRGAAGRTYVVFGKAGGTAVELSDVAVGSGGFVINGASSGDVSGTSVSGAGDVNGDGLADVVVGAPGAQLGDLNIAGKTYVVFGKADGTPVELSDVATGSGGFVLNGDSHGDGSGISVSGAGDVNGDGLADVIVGAPGANMETGASYVVFGKADGSPVALSELADGTGGLQLDGIETFDHSGASVSGAGDVNGDGLADVVVGAPGADPGGFERGESYVVFSAESPSEIVTYVGHSPSAESTDAGVVPPVTIQDSRVTIDFADNGAGAASTETVTLMRSSARASNVPADTVADVLWKIETDRLGFTSADVTFAYRPNEVAGINETVLMVFKADQLEGPWEQVPSVVNIDKNIITAVALTDFGFFALGAADAPTDAGTPTCGAGADSDGRSRLADIVILVSSALLVVFYRRTCGWLTLGATSPF